MINNDKTIPCPVCQTKIPFDAKQLLVGVQYSCPNYQCDAMIGLATESKPIVKDVLEKLDTIQNTA